MSQHASTRSLYPPRSLYTRCSCDDGRDAGKVPSTRRGAATTPLPGPGARLLPSTRAALLLDLNACSGHFRGLLHDPRHGIVSLHRHDGEHLVQGRRRWWLLRLLTKKLRRKIASALKGLTALEGDKIGSITPSSQTCCKGRCRFLQIASHGLERRSQCGCYGFCILACTDRTRTTHPTIPILDKALQLLERRIKIHGGILRHDHQFLGNCKLQGRFVFIVFVCILDVLQRHQVRIRRQEFVWIFCHFAIQLHGVSLQ
mmetsp:Transcript_18709/g.48537  ORF Transcript_18709/g.48537 Transcript_18709/m.48537 type:complete len:258 (+) Transcript_18709:37-810(+)